MPSEPGGLLGSGIMKIKVQMKFGAWAQSFGFGRGRCSTGRLSMAKSPEATRSPSNALVPLFGGRGNPLLKWTKRKKLVPTSSDSGGPEALVSAGPLDSPTKTIDLVNLVDQLRVILSAIPFVSQASKQKAIDATRRKGPAPFSPNFVGLGKGTPYKK